MNDSISIEIANAIFKKSMYSHFEKNNKHIHENRYHFLIFLRNLYVIFDSSNLNESEIEATFGSI